MKRAWSLSGVLTVLMGLAMACGGPTSTPTTLPDARVQTPAATVESAVLIPVRIIESIPTPTPALVLIPESTPAPTGTPTPTRTPVVTSAPTTPPTPGDSPLEFVMQDNYALGQNIEIKIRNNGTTTYVYNEYYPACGYLEFYDLSQEAREFEWQPGYNVERPPGFFNIPEGTHCELDSRSLIRPGEEVVILTWSQRECIKEFWGCVESVPVETGRYTIVGKLFESKCLVGSFTYPYRIENEIVVEWSFTIGL